MRKDKLFNGKTLAILSGGGDTPAINSSIEAVRNRASMLGFRVYGVLRGWKGLLGDGDIVDLTNIPYNGLYGGTALLSSRTNPFPSKKSPEDRSQQILRNIERYKIDVLVTIGGDDTNGAAKKMYETYGIPVIGMAAKPGPFGDFRAVLTLRTSPKKMLMLGDQLFTDILGANLAGCKSIWVEPYEEDKREGFFLLKRKLERLVSARWE